MIPMVQTIWNQFLKPMSTLASTGVCGTEVKVISIVKVITVFCSTSVQLVTGCKGQQ